MTKKGIESIIISELFKRSKVSELKVQDRVKLIQSGSYPVLTLNAADTLIDGYASYVAYKRLGYIAVPVTYNQGDDRIKNTHSDFVEKQVKSKKRTIVPKTRLKLHSSGMDLRMVYAKDNGRCYICGRRCLLDLRVRNGLMATVDHVVPLSKGGMDIDSNKRLACQECNLLKGNFTYSQELVKVIRRELAERGNLDDKDEMCYNTAYRSL